ncbi:efflux RND transporter periplasmic adaptor subunit [Azonexus sp.]|uniref:efflux RND transporter periplasmic adaptor subunit n=1 Tax=Azonexus sp. TaxID=1872668 RepID=UPI0039E3B11B
MSRVSQVLLCFAAVFVGSVQAAEIAMTVAQSEKLGIVTQNLADLALAEGLHLPAQVVVPPAQIAVLAAPMPALVGRVHVAYGESVRAGQIVAELQGPAFLEAYSAHVQAQSQAALASENCQRDESLLADGIIAQSRLSASRAAERQARALAAEKRQIVQTAGITAKGTAVLRSPFAGVVLAAQAEPGTQVDALTPLFKLAQVSPLWLEMQASAAQAEAVPLGAQIKVSGCPRPARVTLVAPAVQAASQSVLVRAELADPGGCVKPLAFVSAQLVPAALPSGQWQVPLAALTRAQEKTWLFVAQAAGFRAVPVEVLAETAGQARIAADLPAGTRIVTRGVAALKGQWLGLGSGQE